MDEPESVRCSNCGGAILSNFVQGKGNTISIVNATITCRDCGHVNEGVNLNADAD